MTDAVQPTTPEAAQGRLAELSSNPEWSSKVNAQDPTAFAEFQNLTKLIASEPAPPTSITVEALSRETSRTNDAKMLDDYLATAVENGWPELTSAAGKDMVEMLRGKPVSQELRDAVQSKLNGLIKDKDWATRLENREARAMREFQISTVILAAPVAETTA